MGANASCPDATFKFAQSSTKRIQRSLPTKGGHRTESDTLRLLVGKVDELNKKNHRFPNMSTGEILQFSVVSIPRNFCLASQDNFLENESKGELCHSARDEKWKDNCNFAKYARTFVCSAQHILTASSQLPPTYVGRYSTVFCDECKRMGIENDKKAFWHCSICEYDCCGKCSETSVFRVLLEIRRNHGNGVKRNQNLECAAATKFQILNPNEFAELYEEITKGYHHNLYT